MICEQIKFEWIKTSKKHAPPHYIILFVDKWDNFHYGVLGSGISPKNYKNKYWCHVFKRSYLKKDVDLWSFVPEHEAMEILYRKIPDAEITLQNNINKIQNKIEMDIIEDAKNRKYENSPGVVVRNALSRFRTSILMLNENFKRTE